jgi:hypothetical protein
MDWFPDYWALLAIAIAGATGIVGLLWDVRDKTTHKITLWGKTLFCITILSTVGAVVAQVLVTRASDARNKKAQEETIQLLTHTRQSIVELSRILQPLDQPTIVLSVDLACGATAYQAFCSSAQSQAAEAIAEFQATVAKQYLPGGVAIEASGPIKNFDWSKWPNGFGPFFPFTRFHVFKTEDKFEEYSKGNCLSCRSASDMTFEEVVTSKVFSPLFQLKSGGADVTFQITFKDVHPEMNNTEVMSIPDLQHAVVVIYAPDFLEILKPTSVSVETPRGQTMRGNFQARDTTTGAKIYFAELSATSK